MADEFGWLIEWIAHPEGKTLWWRTPQGGRDPWTSDSMEATRFARREDAFEVILWMNLKQAAPTEHGWGWIEMVDDINP